MKKEVILDDLTGEQADTSITFGLNDKTYEIDLSEENAQELVGTLEKYARVARVKLMQNQSHRVTSSYKESDSNQDSGAHPNSREIRRWARREGYNVKGRGRIPANVVRDWEDKGGNNGSYSDRRRTNDSAA